jgi:hypothetical protein
MPDAQVLKGNQETAQRSASVHRQGSRRSTAFKENLQKIIPVITYALSNYMGKIADVSCSDFDKQASCRCPAFALCG